MLNDNAKSKYNKLINANELLTLLYSLDEEVLDCDRVSISKIKELILELPYIDSTKIPRFKVNDIVESNWISNEPLIVTKVLDDKHYTVYSILDKKIYTDVSEDNLIFYNEYNKPKSKEN